VTRRVRDNVTLMFKATRESKPDISTLRKYPHRLNLFVSCLATRFVESSDLQFSLSYDIPPLGDVTIEEFEISALNRLRVLAEIESSFARNRSWDELQNVTTAQSKKYLPLNSNVAHDLDLESERRRDHLGHFVLRLAFCRS